MEDHCKGLFAILKKVNGESYNVGTGNNIKNLNLANFY